MQNLSVLLLAIVGLASAVLADQIYIYSPPKNGIYKPKDIMDIRYKVRNEGMVKLWAADTVLRNTQTNQTVSGFPSLKWVQGSSGSGSLHTVWNVPDELAPGAYTISVGGNSSYLCAQNNDSSSPYSNCESDLFAFQTFYVSTNNSTN
ncbi:hypothetical protein K501DRAFT_269296 [Backusella circina FSU 941]|nr:hypothetical protein K501DRAFT_269296 [Backusella circina FSU 941]